MLQHKIHSLLLKRALKIHSILPSKCKNSHNHCRQSQQFKKHCKSVRASTKNQNNTMSPFEWPTVFDLTSTANCNWMSRLDRFKNISSSSSWESVWDVMTSLHDPALKFTSILSHSQNQWHFAVGETFITYVNAKTHNSISTNKHFYEIVLTRCLVRREFLTGQCPSWAIWVVTNLRLAVWVTLRLANQNARPKRKRKARWGFL